jgi:hypothetical protein
MTGNPVVQMQVLTETCHHMHDRSSRKGGRDGEKHVTEGREDSANVG